MSWFGAPGGYLGERATCTECLRVVKVHMPKGGDSTARITYWHKSPITGGWCRSAVDVDSTVAVGDR